jgi:hypothetical protein
VIRFTGVRDIGARHFGAVARAKAAEASDLPDKQNGLHRSFAAASWMVKSTRAETAIFANDFNPTRSVQPSREKYLYFAFS